MTATYDYFDPDEIDLDDADLGDSIPGYADAFDVDDELSETTPCPYCRKPVYEFAEYCPRCGKYLSKEDAPSLRKPIWIVVGVVICLLALLIAWIL